MLHTRSKLLLRLIRAACTSPKELYAAERGYAMLAAQRSCLGEPAGAAGHCSCPSHSQQTRTWQQQQQWQQASITSSLGQSPWGTACNNRHISFTTSSSNRAGSSTTAEGTEAATTRPRDMAIMFTCAKCDTRSVKAFTRQAYERGLVLITCPGCKAMHLIADHLGWFGDSGFKIDEYLTAQGQHVKRVSLDAAQQQPDPSSSAGGLHQQQPQQQQPALTPEDMIGWSKVQQLLSTVAAAAAGGGSSETHGGGGCGGVDRHHADHKHSSTTNTGTSTGSSSSNDAQDNAAKADGMSQQMAAAAAAAAAADRGVVDVSPEDMQSWARVQQQQQPKQ